MDGTNEKTKRRGGHRRGVDMMRAQARRVLATLKRSSGDAWKDYHRLIGEIPWSPSTRWQRRVWLEEVETALELRHPVRKPGRPRFENRRQMKFPFGWAQ